MLALSFGVVCDWCGDLSNIHIYDWSYRGVSGFFHLRTCFCHPPHISPSPDITAVLLTAMPVKAYWELPKSNRANYQ